MRATMSAKAATMSAKAAFDASARDYDRSRRRLVPCFDDFYASALELLPFAPEAPLRVLDLGAGTGLLSAFVRGRFPRAELVLADVAPEMLREARERFAGDPGVACVALDLQDPHWPSPLQAAPFDAVVSGLAIHHVPDAGKRTLFRRILAALREGGVFVNADQVSGETPRVEARQRAAWLRRVRELGTPEDVLAAAIERMRHDRPATLEAQLGWLRDAGFHDVHCAYRSGMFAVVAGAR
jgi:tRNA (cmo5U34)-methyltransferase